MRGPDTLSQSRRVVGWVSIDSAFVVHPRSQRDGGGRLARETKDRDDVTTLLAAWQEGDETARNQLLDAVYAQLRRLAAGQLRRHGAAATLQPTELVHEAFFRLERAGGIQDRDHFMAICATAMRHILIDAAKRRARLKRGGGQKDVTLEEALLPHDEDVERVLAVGEALDRLRAIDERLVQVLECRFFSGLTEAETARALGVSSRTVTRDWVRARAWLARTLGDRFGAQGEGADVAH